ncbi:PREDICTED: uncharacterized protein LOC106337430 [Brassica oleracea var. oleracea]|uniref:uncharacterized protein LOC106337430 n=1 Tax=Brassica oleracea var. oleracea TaxID=109376 RepID=UPI0006A6B71D|nr:PREDICTED: uncharacterized protein LOC106337430 [Brassica oleracea var. oleracea]
MSENYFDQLLTVVHDMLPVDNVLPRSTDEVKKFLKVFGFGYNQIHACTNDCILYRREYKDMTSCPRCGLSRWERDKHTGEERTGIPAKVLRYFPIKDRFRRMFRSKRMAEDLVWHFNNASSDGTMRHPVDSITWSTVKDKWPQFSDEARNLRLGLCTDGMNPFSFQSSTHSTWPVLLVNYNMHPTKCLKEENIMLTLLIPGPTAPSNNIDVYLAPLIDDLKDLWNEGMVVYDAFKKENFTLKAMLLWTVSDYPGLGTLAGCKVKGKQACTVCGKDTPFRWLKFSRKHVYLGNRKRLRPEHPYRRRRKWFDNTVEEGTVSRIESGRDIFETVKDFRNHFGKPLEKNGKRKINVQCEDEVISEDDEYEEDTDHWRWKKRSILFDLPYWKSKDGVKSRKDLEDMGIRKNLHVQLKGKRTYLPHAAYWLKKDEKKRFCKRLSLFRRLDGYSANISSCVSIKPPTIGGLKSHDHHVLLQNLLPVALRGLLPDGPRIAVTRLCSFFNSLCQRVLDPEKLISLENELVETMCEMERYFPQASPDKILIIDWTSDDVIAEGGLFSTDPKQLVNNIPLGPNAAIVKVEKVLKKNAYLWRPSPEMSTIADALHQSIAWPIQKIDIINQSPKRVSPLSSSPQSVSNSLDTAKSSPEKKCILLDCFNSGKTIAEGRVVFTNPEDRVHFVPLGENASKVFVLVAKIGDAKVWRPNAEVEFISDAFGTTVAWPNDKVIFV